jgi:membrane associated rhomboid family serine protease
VNDPLYRINHFLDESLTPAVKMILLINVGVFLAHAILVALRLISLISAGELEPLGFTIRQPWRVLTYMFLHGSLMHLLLNLLGLWFFGPPLENRWGTRRFWQFYLITGVGAALLYLIINSIFPLENGYVIGASGAIYGLILAMCAYNPNAQILLYFLVPIPMKFFLLFAVAIGVFGLMSHSGTQSNISNLTHLLGLGVAYVWLAFYHKDWNYTTWRWR